MAGGMVSTMRYIRAAWRVPPGARRAAARFVQSGIASASAVRLRRCTNRRRSPVDDPAWRTEDDVVARSVWSTSSGWRYRDSPHSRPGLERRFGEIRDGRRLENDARHSRMTAFQREAVHGTPPFVTSFWTRQLISSPTQISFSDGHAMA